MKQYLIKGINKEGEKFELKIYAECIEHAAMTTVYDFIKEITSIEEI